LRERGIGDVVERDEHPRDRGIEGRQRAQ
jgi:hypothetical protein